MGQDNVVPRRINKVDGAAGEVMESSGAGVAEVWVQKLESYVLATTRDMTAASGVVGYTGVGFQPTCIIVIACIDGSYEFSIGIVDSAGDDRSIHAPTNATWQEQTEFLYFDRGGGDEHYAVFTSFDTDGFTLTWTKVNNPGGNAQLRFLCLR